MPIDTSIYQNYLRPPKSVQEYGAEMDAAEQNRLGLQAQRMNLLSAQQAQQDDQALRALYQRPDFNPQSEAGIAELMRVSPKAGAAAYQAQLAAKKTQGEIEETKTRTTGLALDQQIKRRQDHVSQLAGVSDVPSAVQWIGDAVKSGELPMDQATQVIAGLKGGQIPLQEWRAKAMMGGLSALDQIREQRQREELALTAARDAATASHQRAMEGLTARGQNMVDARARETNATTVTKPFEVTGPDGSPMLVRQDKQGNITPVTGYGPKTGASKPLTEGQAKALGFGSRMQEADKLLSGLENKGVTTPSLIKQAAESVPLVGGALGMVANGLASEDQQSVEQAQRDFVNAILRRESGAAVSESEFANARKQYFGQPGDGSQVLEQKRRNRELAIRGVLAEVPEGKRESLSKPTGGASGGWSVVEVK